MANYRPRGGRWSVSSQLVGWGLLVLAVLLVGSFLLGMYYGYSNGYDAARREFADSGVETPARTQSDTPPVRNRRSVTSPSDTPSRGPSGAITRGDLRYTEPTDTSGTPGGTVPTDGDATPDTTPRSIPADPISSSASRAGTPAQSTDGDSPVSLPYFTIQVVSTQKRENALRVRDRLRERGHSSMISEATVEGTKYYRVRLGRFPTRSKASQYAEETQSKGHIENFWISKITAE